MGGGGGGGGGGIPLTAALPPRPPRPDTIAPRPCPGPTATKPPTDCGPLIPGMAPMMPPLVICEAKRPLEEEEPVPSRAVVDPFVLLLLLNPANGPPPRPTP